MNNLQARIAVGVVGIPVALGVIWIGGWWFAGLVFLISAIGLREYYALAAGKQGMANVNLGLGFGLAMQGCIAAAFVDPSLYSVVEFVMLAMLLFVIGVLITLAAELYRAKEHAIINTAVTVMGVAYVSLSLASLIVLRGLQWPMVTSDVLAEAGAALLITLFVSIWMCDSAAYFVGMKFGRHKLFLRVSPGKSWEGAIAGFAVCAATFWLLGTALMPRLDDVVAIGAGVLVGIVGQVGDLCESLLKRDAMIKDSSTLIPGHGGVLDRFDSILFAAPFLLLYLYLIHW